MAVGGGGGGGGSVYMADNILLELMNKHKEQKTLLQKKVTGYVLNEDNVYCTASHCLKIE